MARLKSVPPRGIVRTPAAHPAAAFAHARYDADHAVAARVEHWWTVRWSLPPGTREERATLPHPSIHVVLEGDRVDVVGVVRGRYTWVSEGSGAIFAAKFRPAMFRALLGPRASVSSLTDRVVPFADVVGTKRAARYRAALLARDDDHARVAAATAFFAALLPAPTARELELRDLVEAVARSIAAGRDDFPDVDAICARFDIGVRDLQRACKDAVGIAPKWMLQRYRLHQALLELEAPRAASGGTVAGVAAALGYADQAHFARDFKKLVGMTPSRYAARLQRTRSSS